jgi:hypothetical protein
MSLSSHRPLQPGAATDRRVLEWLLAGDVSIQYQARRDLLGEDDPNLRTRIATEGWGARFLARRNGDGSWGQRFYQPKWTSTHYTLLDLKNLAVVPDRLDVLDSIHKVVLEEKLPDGGIGPAKSTRASDVCVNGMFLNYACYFGEPERSLRSIVDFVLAERMGDGGFNCFSNTVGARHSSLHSTISVLEGFHEYVVSGYRYRRDEIVQSAASAREFILQHRLFRSDHTGEIIAKGMVQFTFPWRWKYNILRALDHFRTAGVPWDDRMTDALNVLLSKRRPDGRWRLPAAHLGQTHFVMEEAGEPSRWNTLIALRVLRAYRPPSSGTTDPAAP